MPKRVLVVEDDDNIAMALQHVIGRAGISHHRVANGRLAYELIRAEPPELVMLDVMLPEMSGYDICRNIRADPQLATVKIVMMTARGSVRERQRGLSLGADGFLGKPFDLQELRAELVRLLP